MGQLLKLHISSDATFEALIFQLFVWNPKIKGQHLDFYYVNCLSLA